MGKGCVEARSEMEDESAMKFEPFMTAANREVLERVEGRALTNPVPRIKDTECQLSDERK